MSTPLPEKLIPVRKAMRQVLENAGVDQLDENFADTAERWTKMLAHFLRPYDPATDLKVAFTEATTDEPAAEFTNGMVIQSNIPFRALCAHHLLPFIGVAHVGYIPKDTVVGLSKLARVVYGISHQTPSLQEHIGRQIVDALQDHLKGLGAMCVITATHGCMECRGVEEHGVKTSTSHVRGVFATRPEAREEFLSVVQLSRT